jgi:hypothetical protein
MSPPGKGVGNMGEVSNEHSYSDSYANSRQDPESNNDRCFRPTEKFKVMMDWRHTEQSFFSS